MTSQKILLNFSDLKNLSREELVEVISPQTAVEVTLSIKACEVSEQDIYKTWSTSLFQSYGPAGMTQKDLNILFDSFSIAIKALLDECGNCQSDDQVDRLREFLTYSLELFTWIHSTASDFETTKITAFLCFGLFSIHSYLVVLSKQTSQTGARELIEKSLKIHSLILGVLAEYPKLFLFNKNVSSLGSLISGLCSVGEITPKLDIKTAVETWKSITKLASQNVTHKQSEDTRGDGVIWLSKPMSCLIKEIGRNVQTVYTQNSLSEPIQQIEKYLKVTNFYLRLLHKLSNDFRHVPFPICEEFIGALAVVFKPPIYIANTPVYEAIMNYIGKDLKELIPLAYRNDIFFEQLISEHSGNVYTTEAIHEIVLQTIEVIIRKEEAKYMNEKLLNASFKYMSESPEATYNRFVEILSSLQVHFNEEQVKKKFITTILHDNTTEALAAIDIWSTIFMSSDHLTRQSYFKFWTDINERFVTFSNSMPAHHTELLLRNLYTLLSSREKNEMWNNFNACTLKNERFLLTIGLDAIPSCAAKQSIIQHFQNELMRLLKGANDEITIQSYYTIVKNLKLLKPIDFQNDNLVEMLLQYLDIAIENKRLYRIVESILDFIVPRIGYIDGNRIQGILILINMNISLFDELSTKLSFIKFLKSVVKLSRFEKQSDEILKKLGSDEQIKLFGYLEENNTNIGVDAETRDSLWNKVIKNRSMVKAQRSHICRIKESHVNMKNNHQADIDALLESLENNTNKLQNHNNQLSTSNLVTIKRVIFKLRGISKLDV